MDINIDIAIFLGFLAVNLVVGLRHGSKNKTISDYALGGRDFSTAALVATIVATWVSGSGFFIDLSNTYSDGLYYLIPSCCMALSLITTAYFLIPRMGEFMGKVSVAEAMGDIYGREVRFITAVSGILGTIGIIAVQFKVFGNVFHHFFGIDSSVAVLIASAIVIVYSAFGGIRAVTYTDIVQFCTFGVVIPLIGVIIWNRMYDSGITIFDALNNPKFDYKEVLNFQNPQFWEMIPLILYFGLPSVKAMDFQRISMGRNLNQVKTAWYISAFLLVVVTLATAWVPFLLEATTPNLPADEIMSYVADNYSYTGLRGLIIIGIAAMAMSTADSCINASAVLFANDLGKVFNIKINELKLSRMFALALGAFAVYLALSKADLLKIVMTSASLYMPVVTVPLLFTIWGFRSSKLPVLVGMGAGFIITTAMKISGVLADAIIWGMVANLVLLLGSHYLLKQPGGWVGIKDNSYLDGIKSERKRKVAHLLDNITNFNFIAFCKSTAPKNELMYMGLGIYCILYTFTTMYTTQVEMLKENGKIILGIYQIMMITGTVMAMYPIWPLRIKKEIVVQVAWNIVIFYMLVFFSCFFVMVSDFGQLQFTAFTINVLITALLVGWQLAAGMMLIGFYLSVQFYKFYTGTEIIDISLGSPQFILMYSLLLVGSALIIFLKPKQEYIEETEHKAEVLEGENAKLNFEVTGLNDQVTDLNGKVVTLNTKVEDLNEQVTHYATRIADHEKEIDRLGQTSQRILNNVNHELRLPIGNVINFADMLHETLQKTENNKLLTELAKEVYDNSYRVSGMILNMLDLATLEVQKIDLEKKTVNLSELVEDRVNQCRKIYQKNKSLEFKLQIEPEIMISIDPNYIRQTVDNLVINAINFSEKGVITITVKKETTEVVFTITDQGKGIPKNELYDIFIPFKMGSNSESKACGRGVGLALCKSAVQAHGGSILADSDGTCGAKLQFTLPFVAPN